MTDAHVREIGRARLRTEDARLLTGRAEWTGNISLPGLLHVAFARSPMAHARITGVDTNPVKARPGVVAAFSGADLAGEQGGLVCGWPVTAEMVTPEHPPMAVDQVAFVGEPVACVLASDRYAAADALEAVEVDYQPLPAVTGLEAAVADGADLVHAGKGTNKAYEWAFAGGDVDAAFADAPVVIRRRYVQQRLIPSPMEPRAVVCAPAGDRFTMWSSTQIPHIVRMMLALVTGIPEHKLRVIAPDVGGGFGGKLQVTAEELLCLVLARKLGRPVRWTETRSESNQAIHHGRGQIQDLALAAGRDGCIRGLKVDLLADMGAYLMLGTPGIAVMGALMFPGIYKLNAYSVNCTGVFTTKTPTDAYRGAGKPEATYAIERLMDELACELGLDPVEVRRRNWISRDEFPFTTITGLTYDSGDYEAATQKALHLFGYEELRAEQAARRACRDPVQLGIGVSTYTEMAGLGPSRKLGELGYAAGGWEQASVRVLPAGAVEVITGTSGHGQGHETAFAQITADALGVPFADISILHGDTQIASKGMDTYGSRSLVVGGIAIHNACAQVIGKARRVAAHLLEANDDDIEFTAGRLQVRGDPDQARTIQEVALATFTAHDLPDGLEPSLDAEATFDPASFSFPHGTHLCAAEVDTETGLVKLRSYVAVDDLGRVVNPLIVDGQIHGGLAQGIGQALYEEAAYDADGNLLTTTLAEYQVPAAPDLPSFITARTETPATTNPLGAKGAGEAGTTAATPAVVNAIVDALRPYGVNDVPMPCTPERVWRAIQETPGDASEPGTGPSPTRGLD